MTTAVTKRRISPSERTEQPQSDDPVLEYAEGVIKGRYPAGKLVRQQCERHIRDLRHAHKRGYTFDHKKANRAIKFFSFLRHYKGEWAGKPLVLEPWQKFIIGSVFGWVNSADGSRRFQIAYIEVPRKNGKSLLGAGVGLYLAFFDGEGGAEVYAASTKRDQAKIVWGDARTLVRSSEALKSRISILGGETGVGSLFRTDTNSKFVPLGADSDTMDGLNSHGLIVDELHAHKNRGTWDVLQTSTGSRKQPLTFAITTAGADVTSVCYEQHEYAEKILERLIEDDSFFAFIATCDEGDDWTKEETWIKANPNYGVSVYSRQLQRLCAKALEVPAEQAEFKRKHLNIWTEAKTSWLLMSTYDKNTEEPNIPALKGRKCFAGLDLSSTQDLTALEIYFPNPQGEGGDWLHFYFMPKASVQAKSRNDRVPYDVWVDQGFITATPGEVVDYNYIRETINTLRDSGYEIQEIAFDPFNATQIVTDLTTDGFTCVSLRQNFSLSPATKELERLMIAGKFRFGKNPVTRWAASNAVTITDPYGNIRLDKSSRRARIDPLAAKVNAIDRATRHMNSEQWSGIWLGDDEESEEEEPDELDEFDAWDGRRTYVEPI